MKGNLLLFDAYHYLHRAFHALPPLATSKGEPVGAIYGFSRILLKTIKQFKPTHIAICWDSKPKARLAIDAQYKANRIAAPQELKSQFVLAREFIRKWTIPDVEIEELEADDIIATMARKAASAGYDVVIVTSDKDILQTVGGAVRVYLEHKQEFMDADAVTEKYGCPPERLAHYFALTGDTVDNIEGIPGIGDKTAKDLMSRYGDIDSIITAAGDPAAQMKPKIRGNIIASIEKLRRNLSLTALNTDAPIDFTPADFRLELTRVSQEFKDLLKRLEFTGLLKDLGIEETPVPQATTALAAPSDDCYAWLPTAAPDWRRIEDPACDKAVYAYKTLLREYPQLANRNQGMVLDIRLMSWIADPSQDPLTYERLTTKYGAGDLATAAKTLRDSLQEKGLWKLYTDTELRLSKTLADMEAAGIHVDRERLDALGQAWHIEMDQIKKNIITASGAGDDLNLNSPKQLAVLLFEKLKLPTFKKTKTGYSTNEEVLAKLSPLHPVAAMILEHREISKLISTYVEGLLAAMDPASGDIHATFNQEGTQTGRLSCNNPNLQNIPVRTERGLKIRGCFTVRHPNQRFLSLDYSQIDLRVFAHLSQDQGLISFFKEGHDIHTQTAKLVFADGGEVTQEMRRHAKAINFGILYGMGPWALAKEIGVTPEEASGFITRYLDRFPAVASWRQATIEQARKDGSVKTLLGRIRYLPEIHSENQHVREFAERAAVNTPVQGTSADIIKLAMLALAGYIYDKGLQTKILLQVHDELLIEGPDKEIEEHGCRFKELMETAMRLTVPISVHAKIGENWKELQDHDLSS
ncbi:MAG: DNA polymerase [Elusimicrobiota bacterium]